MDKAIQSGRLTRREAMALAGAASAAALINGGALAQGAPKKGGVLKVSANANPSSLDPQTGGAGSDHTMLYPMYDTLTEWDYETLKPKPGLASSWSFTDPQTLVLNLRSGVTFHDGTPLDAEAVKFNFERAKTEQRARHSLGSCGHDDLAHGRQGRQHGPQAGRRRRL